MTKKGHGNTVRDSAGVTVTMRHRDTDEPVTVYRGGGVKVALSGVLALFDPDEWYLGCVSTPRTILADLNGRPERTVPHAQRPGGIEYDKRTANTPEMVLLGVLGQRGYAR